MNNALEAIKTEMRITHNTMVVFYLDYANMKRVARFESAVPDAVYNRACRIVEFDNNGNVVNNYNPVDL